MDWKAVTTNPNEIASFVFPKNVQKLFCLVDICVYADHVQLNYVLKAINVQFVEENFCDMVGLEFEKEKEKEIEV